MLNKNLDEMSKGELLSQTCECGYPLYKMFGHASGDGKGHSEMELHCPNCNKYLNFENGKRKEAG